MTFAICREHALSLFNIRPPLFPEKLLIIYDREEGGGGGVGGEGWDKDKLSKILPSPIEP